jgi:hypothetical protein
VWFIALLSDNSVLCACILYLLPFQQETLRFIFNNAKGQRLEDEQAALNRTRIASGQRFQANVAENGEAAEEEDELVQPDITKWFDTPESDDGGDADDEVVLDQPVPGEVKGLLRRRRRERRRSWQAPGATKQSVKQNTGGAQVTKRLKLQLGAQKKSQTCGGQRRNQFGAIHYRSQCQISFSPATQTAQTPTKKMEMGLLPAYEGTFQKQSSRFRLLLSGGTSADLLDFGACTTEKLSWGNLCRSDSGSTS